MGRSAANHQIVGILRHLESCHPVGVLCYNLVAVIFFLLVAVNWLVRKTVFCTGQVIGWEARLYNDI